MTFHLVKAKIKTNNNYMEEKSAPSVVLREEMGRWMINRKSPVHKLLLLIMSFLTSQRTIYCFYIFAFLKYPGKLL